MTDKPPTAADRVPLTPPSPHHTHLLPHPGGGGRQFAVDGWGRTTDQSRPAGGKIDSQSLGKDMNWRSYVTDLPPEWTNVSIPIKLAGAIAVLVGKNAFYYHLNRRWVAAWSCASAKKPSPKPWRLTCREGSVNGQVLRTQRQRDWLWAIFLTSLPAVWKHAAAFPLQAALPSRGDETREETTKAPLRWNRREPGACQISGGQSNRGQIPCWCATGDISVICTLLEYFFAWHLSIFGHNYLCILHLEQHIW